MKIFDILSNYYRVTQIKRTVHISNRVMKRVLHILNFVIKRALHIMNVAKIPLRI